MKEACVEHVYPFTGLCLSTVQDLEQDLGDGERKDFSSPRWHGEFYSFPFFSRAFDLAFATVLICHLLDERKWVDVIAEEVLSPFLLLEERVCGVQADDGLVMEGQIMKLIQEMPH